MEKEEFVVNGYLFQRDEDAKTARKEEKQIVYIEERMEYDKPDKVLAVYQTLLDTNVFCSIVGYTYLNKVRQFLEIYYDDNELPVISLQFKNSIMRESYAKLQIERFENMRTSFGKKLRICYFSIFLLCIAVIAMFVITLTADTPNMLNYERVITNKYSTWEQELTERENSIREKDRMLDNRSIDKK